MAVLASIVVALAALLHAYIFVLESLRWTHPRTRAIFNVRSAEDAQTLKPMAYNQGFYNLFLGMGAALGLVLFWSDAAGDGLAIAGRALVLFTTACMVLAAVVLTTTGRRYLRPALVQGTLPLIGFVLFALA